MDTTVLEKSPLFEGINEEEIPVLLQCLGAREKSFSKGDFVFRFGDKPTSVGIVLAGTVHVIQEDYWGNRTIISRIGSAGLFGESFACSDTMNLPVSVVATQDARILFINYKKIVTTCSSACTFHNSLIKNMLSILANKNVFLTRKMSHLGERTIRDKVLSYLSEQALEAKTSRFAIPFNRQELAHYLSVDRSALSRELGNMQKEGLLTYSGKRFELFQESGSLPQSGTNPLSSLDG